MEYEIGTHTLTFQSILNGEVRGSTNTMFIVTNSKLILFTVTFLINEKNIFLTCSVAMILILAFSMYYQYQANAY